VDHVADRLDVLEVRALEVDVVALLYALRERDEVERVDVDVLERGVAGDRVCVGTEVDERLGDRLFDRLWRGCRSHGGVLSVRGVRRGWDRGWRGVRRATRPPRRARTAARAGRARRPGPRLRKWSRRRRPARPSSLASARGR